MSAEEDASQTLEQSMHGEDTSHFAALPSIAAAFLISFDLKVGYTISWKRSIDGLNLEGVAEFKSLPSGLHNIKEDIVYFVHEQYAGISAFVNRPAAESDRNAQFVAFGVLVPLSYGRLGRSWVYTQKLQELARDAARDIKQTQPLEEFWEQHRQGEAGAAGPASPVVAKTRQNGPQPSRRKRGLSTVTAMDRPGRRLPRSHPILSLPNLLALFGPLIYPLQRAALLRKRILLVTQPPVRIACEYVYDISLLSTLSSALAEQLPESADLYLRSTPLFIVGVHDIPFLSPNKQSATADADPDVSKTGWIACTTDEILTMKKEIYDIIVELPNPNGKSRWPAIKTSDDKTIKATQRDLRRWRVLQRALARSRTERYSDEDGHDAEDDDERAGLLHSSYPQTDETDGDSYDDVVEPTSWGELARSGFMWWASAGERDAAMDQEAEQDAVLVGDLESLHLPPTPDRYSDDEDGSHSLKRNDSGKTNGQDDDDIARDQDEAVDPAAHMELLAYFHRYSHQIFAGIRGAVEAEDTEGEGDGEAVHINDDDLLRSGLDSWSEQDRVFVVEIVRMYFGRECTVRGAGVECCGVRLC